MGDNENVEERFWGKVNIGSQSECWPWTAGEIEGYGSFGYRGRNWLAHRVAWTWSKGEIPPGLCVCHHCDNRCCVNPGHLFLGTRADNQRDMVRKGRAASGESNAQAKLTEPDVIAIRALRKDGMLQYEIAERFGISRANVGYIVRRKTWTQVP